ncbi:hypothetical protein [Dactylosporangium sp. NPDC050588]|uniref:hypothetical protein n=1 Tax=Dactylosporangium sp. NPDC050588 TaxID=3157211 RepID=UPI00340F413D
MLSDEDCLQLVRWLVFKGGRFTASPPARLLAPFSEGDDPNRAGTAFERTTHRTRQRTELTTAQKKTLAALGLPNPRRVFEATPATP